MKILTTFCGLVLSLFLAAQGSYKLPFESIKNRAGNPLKLDSVVLNDNTVGKASVIITNVPEAEKDNLKFRLDQNQNSTVKGESSQDGSLTFKVKDLLKNGKGKFNLSYKEAKVAEFVFDKPGGSAGSEKTGDEDDPTAYITALASANFVGNNKFLANLTPVVHFGATVNLRSSEYNSDKYFRWDLDINPYLGAQIDTKDSVSFIPALMLPGRAGLQFNSYLIWGGKKAEFTWLLPGLGLKIIPGLRDSTINIWQHNLRTGIAVRYGESFMLAGQVTYGFHNTTSESSRFFKDVFSKRASDIVYLTLSGQFELAPKEDEETRSNFLFLEWRGLLSKKRFPGFDNVSMITFGFRKNLALANTFPVGSSGKHKRIPNRF